MPPRKTSKHGNDKNADQVKRPWDDEPDDPSVKPNDVAFTAWIKCHLKAGIKDKVSASFGWLKESGDCSSNVNTGNAGTWSVESQEGDDPENPESLELLFEKSTDAISCEPKFLRKFVEQTLRVTVTYPAPEPPPPADPDEPVETPEPLQATIALPLAPLMMLNEENDELEISDLICKDVQCAGIMSFQIGVRLDKEMLSEEVAGALNPVLVSLEYAKDLPEELHLKQNRRSVFASLSMFGQKSNCPPSQLSDEGMIVFNHHKCFFVGKWHQHRLREYIQTNHMLVEVHDRDGEKSEEQGSSASTIFPHGGAKFSFSELLNPAITTQPVNMRADLAPIVRSTKERKGGTGTESLQAETLFSEEAKELLASMTTKEREYAPGHFGTGAYVEVTVKMARPLPLPDILQKAEEQAAAKPTSSSGKKKKGEEEDDEETKIDLRYERFGRVILVLDYKKTTIVKKLLALITLHNTKVMNMESGPSRALATRQLTDAEKANNNLDILSGFIVMDRTCRVILIEGLRSGALNDVVEAVGRPQKNHKKWKMLYHPDVGFSERRYVDFDLCLKQIKLRQYSLEVLMQRPDLYDRSRTEEDVAVTLECLMEFKRAERMHTLKLNCSFPTAKNLLTIETQYGDFVTDLELEGGCVDDDGTKTDGSKGSKSKGSKSKGSQGGSKSGRPESRSKSIGSKESKDNTSAQGSKKSKDQTATSLDKTQLPDEEMEESSSDEDEKTMKKQRITMKAETVHKNEEYEKYLAQKATEEAKDMRAENKAKIKEASAALALNNPNRRQIDQSFLEGMPIAIYSGQKLCTTELQKAHLRAKMKDNAMYTYSQDYNSGCFPLVDDVGTLEDLLRQSVADETSAKHAEPWRYPKPRTLEDYKKPLRDLSDARKEELSMAWQENEWSADGMQMARTGVVKGAFDAGTLGGGHNVLPLRRVGLQPLEEDKTAMGASLHAQFEETEDKEPQKATKKLEHPPMKFLGQHKPDRPNMVDKYFKQIRDGEAQHHALRFDKRRADQWLQKMEESKQLSEGSAAKYGKGHCQSMETVQTLPSSYQHNEQYIEPPRTSEHPFQLAKDCSKPVAPYGPGVLGIKTKSIYINSKRTPLTDEDYNGLTFKRPPTLNFQATKDRLKQMGPNPSGSLSAR